MDPDNGEAAPGAIRARATMTLALPKQDADRGGRDQAGAVYLADIGLRPCIYARMGLRWTLRSPLWDSCE